MRIALFQPEIAGNVGAILRLAACLDAGVDIVEPCGFAFADRALRRAGLDYAARAAVTRHADWGAFRAATPARLVLLTTHGAIRLPDAAFRADDVLLFGAEGAGVPDHVHAAAVRVRILLAPGFRSLNLAIAAGIALGEALRQTGGFALDRTRRRTTGRAHLVRELARPHLRRVREHRARGGLGRRIRLYVLGSRG